MNRSNQKAESTVSTRLVKIISGVAAVQIIHDKPHSTIEIIALVRISLDSIPCSTHESRTRRIIALTNAKILKNILANKIKISRTVKIIDKTKPTPGKGKNATANVAIHTIGKSTLKEMLIMAKIKVNFPLFLNTPKNTCNFLL